MIPARLRPRDEMVSPHCNATSRVDPRVVDAMLSHLGRQGAHDSVQDLAQALDTS
ncbi:hypothetical protein [Streptomyces akebiae]|uniref:Uncharacterized protein n=1 Tax=Streptomyces akebiae TaxID=2865673 RepID=A0ABX8XRP0_9ACTN|nr:hypothetical protein [Streptomyces akebiae]QYX78566.1 hypothetical protein K1J60_20255 [Streptomyces akebiae]